jgi:LDH2 family malate/lactate/ureidoglycolate dehydrogenase
VAAPTWTALTLENGWTGSPFGTAAPAVANDNGIVFMKGAIATTGTNPVAFVLPSADRPAHVVDVAADMCNATTGRLQIEPTGVVTVQAPGTTFSNAACFTSLDGIVFAP